MNTNHLKILFVCTGNSCRSPMAEGILKHLLKKEGVDSVLVESAGTMAPEGMAPTNNALLAMVERGLDISGHRARTLTKEMVEDSDLIFVMEKAHQRFVEHMVPSAREKVFLLKAYRANGEKREVEDPIGGDLEVYRNAYDELEREIQRVFPMIKALAKKKQSPRGHYG